MYSGSIKRAFDIVLSATALTLLSPVVLVLCAVIWNRMGRPVVFRQIRPGLNGRLFPCLKFRTMTDDRDENGQLLPDRERLTPLGAWLRKTSLDEIPQLWNILNGDLSFIGPRPLLVEYLPYYTPEEQQRHSVRPGLTGWAQIHGRNELNFNERLKMDVWYVDHLTWRLDLEILLATIRLVFSSQGTGLVTYAPLHEQRRMSLSTVNDGLGTPPGSTVTEPSTRPQC